MTTPPRSGGRFRAFVSPELVALLLVGGLSVAIVSGSVRFAEAGRAAPSPSQVAGGTPSAPPSAAASSASAATSRPISSPSPSPSASGSAGPTVSPAGVVNVLLNPGFEDPSRRPWQLVVDDPAAAATFATDPTNPAAGRLSARIDITATSESRSGIALRQGGLRIDSGVRYVCSIRARAGTLREVQVRIVGSAGETYGTRLFTVGTEWQLLAFGFVSLVSDPGAAFEVDLGRSSATAWLDDASLGAAQPDQIP